MDESTIFLNSLQWGVGKGIDISKWEGVGIPTKKKNCGNIVGISHDCCGSLKAFI